MLQLPALQLTNFRSHTDLQLTLGEQTILLGPNGAGKTNILEAIYFLATTSGFRGKGDAILIREHETVARVVGGEFEAALAKDGRRTKKIFKLRGLEKKLSEVPGELPVVLFSPELLQVIAGSPAERRRFLNLFLAQLDLRYATLLQKYRLRLLQRNALLQAIKNGERKEEELQFWDTELAAVGGQITSARRQFLANLSRVLEQTALPMLNLHEVSLRLIETVPHGRSLEEALMAARGTDVRYGQTTVGPHRDDLSFRFLGKALADFGSRGEWRRALLTVQFAVLLLLEEAGKTGLLLLDDVYSELDAEHRHLLSAMIAGRPVVVTTTERANIGGELPTSATVIEVVRHEP